MASTIQARSGLHRTIAIEIEQRQCGALRREAMRNGSADATRATGDCSRFA
jgi:hypothetical protein